MTTTAAELAEILANDLLTGWEWARIPGPPDAVRMWVKDESGDEFVVQVECVRTVAP